MYIYIYIYLLIYCKPKKHHKTPRSRDARFPWPGASNAWSACGDSTSDLELGDPNARSATELRDPAFQTEVDIEYTDILHMLHSVFVFYTHRYVYIYIYTHVHLHTHYLSISFVEACGVSNSNISVQPCGTKSYFSRRG